MNEYTDTWFITFLQQCKAVVNGVSNLMFNALGLGSWQ